MKTKREIKIGRLPSPANDVQILNPFVSREHAVITIYDDNNFTIKDTGLTGKGSKSGTFINGKRLLAGKEYTVTNNDLIKIAHIPYSLSDFADIREPKVLKTGIDIISKNLTFSVENKDGSKFTILDDISLAINPGEIVGLIGPSGSGKTSLLMCLSGVKNPFENTNQNGNNGVYVRGINLHKNLDYFKGSLGYVPQDDIMHRELTVYESLKYTADLRLNKDTEDIKKRKIDNALELLDIQHIKDNIIGDENRKGISGGQRKRVNLGQELVSDPQVLFLDEVTSGLDPKTDVDIMNLLRNKADNGTTIVLTTHNINSRTFHLFDKIIVLTKGGKLAFVGPPSGVYDYFIIQNPEEIFDKIVAPPIESNNNDAAIAWNQKYYHSNFKQKQEKIINSRKTIDEINDSSEKNKSFKLRQLSTLVSRNNLIKRRDKKGTAILLLQAPIIALLIAIVFSNSYIHPTVKRQRDSLDIFTMKMNGNLDSLTDAYTGIINAMGDSLLKQSHFIDTIKSPSSKFLSNDEKEIMQDALEYYYGVEIDVQKDYSSYTQTQLDSVEEILNIIESNIPNIDEKIENELPIEENNHTSAILFVLAIAAIWLGTSNSVRDIVGEQPIFKRERMVNVSIYNYLLSKLITITVLSLVQCIALGLLTSIFLGFELHIFDYFLLFIIILVGVSVGLLISAYSETNEQAMAIVPITIIPQVIFAGLIVPTNMMGQSSSIGSFFSNLISNLMPVRWGYQGLLESRIYNYSIDNGLMLSLQDIFTSIGMHSIFWILIIQFLLFTILTYILLKNKK